ncbi:glycerate kinase [Acinetobacter baumannii]|nr:glycerate kinase [Acinetobacter baumannii]
MKVVIAPDSFKDSLSALKVAQAIAQGWQAVFPHAETILCPMADGGEGTIEAVLEVCEGQWREKTVGAEYVSRNVLNQFWIGG